MEETIETIVYKKIKSEILTGNIKVGEAFSEASLSKSTGYSRSPIRSALKQLEHEKLVTYKKNRGVVLREASIKELADITQICVNWLILTTEQVAAGLGSFAMDDIQQLLNEAKTYRQQMDYVNYMNKMPEVYMAIMAASPNDLLVSTYQWLSSRVISASIYKKMANPKNSPKKTLSTVQFFQTYIDHLRAEDYSQAIGCLKDYQQYANHQILYYGYL
ncbi:MULTISPECIES: GntR family transcriptional regulator [unclassified Enterococcus]|uniref:GntR family transcriptional regulator n=1 Tax=unclassified Enterococcus TaxID=2608891 RepID=UPI001904440D|nr:MULTISPECIES: GntR family transcriptional regulator [unclassified Enterococcus]MBK0037305.1 GntR family transcriptional regulator [Enterococcus sp. S52]MBK0069968.1 GntR family transcriptional regulator [Enterococcus sp. S53]MBK0140808.1 GntR family transcriptional regulator [Enterococcus sp. S76]MBK0144196.1 GntR family transcriptional regulator [Enterococcus sp. S77]